MELDNGTQDDFEQNDDGTLNDESESQPQETELDLSQPYMAITGDDGNEVTLTGQEVMDRISENLDLQKQIAELSAKANQPAPQPVYQPAPAPVQAQQDPITGIRDQAQDALTRFANGDMDAIPTLLDAIGQFAEIRAQSATSTTLSEQQRDSQFLAAHPDAPEAINGALAGEFATFRARNPFYADGVQAYLAFKADRATVTHQKEIADLKAQIATAGAKGKQAGEKETLQTMKARGGIRLLQGGGTARASTGGGSGKVQNFSNSEDAAEAMKAALKAMRGGSLD
jgi:hypothetical protein